MRKAVALAMLTCAAAALTSNNSYAKNPLLDGVTGTAVMAEKDLASVKGSGFTAAYYSYLGGYYLAYAQLYANYGNYYNSAGYTNSTYGSYFNLAANNAYNAYYYYNIARQN